ncbi:hypothetical protein [Neorhizobium sp. NCHU2750]|uniref:hypothetical protein n=1 Tax=Neorhizobium sp. NCHU2750 TaxID=1825976 RepID=UPI000E72C102
MRLNNPVTVMMVLCGLAFASGCSTTSRGGSVAGGLLSPKPSASAPYITALQGGIVSRTGAELSASDNARALEAEYRALEDTAGGQTISWKGDKASGEVTANAPYQVGEQNCRQYRHSVTVDGKQLMARGAACRNSNGTWTPLS